MNFLDVAKDSNAGVGTRAEAAKDAVGDKAKETKHTVRLIPNRVTWSFAVANLPVLTGLVNDVVVTLSSVHNPFGDKYHVSYINIEGGQLVDNIWWCRNGKAVLDYGMAHGNKLHTC